MFGGFGWQHFGNLRSDPFLQNANRYQHVHSEPGHSRRVLPHRHPLPLSNHDQQTVDLRQCRLQSLHDLHQHQPIHKLHLPVHHERGQIHRGLSSHLVSKMADASDIEDSVVVGLDLQHRLDDAHHRTRDGAGAPTRTEVLHHRLEQQ